MTTRESVVLVNGLWLGNPALWLLARRLRRAGFAVYPFSYPSVRNGLRANAECLQRFLEQVPGATVHWVGYSLGGLVIRALFQFYPDQRPGRIVLLGSPQQGSVAAAATRRHGFGRMMTGRSVAELVAGIPQKWAWPARDIGVLAGTRAVGLGRVFARLSATGNDGTVLIAETRVDDARDQRSIPVAHSALLMSPLAARCTDQFLRTGRFDP